MYRDGPESAEPDAVAPESLAPLAAAGTTEPDPNRCSLMVLTVAIYEPLMDERCRWVWGQGSRAMCEVRRSTHCTLHKHCDMVERWVVKRKTSGPKFPIWGTMVDSRSCLSLSLLRFLSASIALQQLLQHHARRPTTQDENGMRGWWLTHIQNFGLWQNRSGPKLPIQRRKWQAEQSYCLIRATTVPP